ncbi:PTS glucose transporter subunit IIB [Mesomycoplasma neurolyticum]|uniref:PTS system IIB component n=1 Tax=Mesomycoplasma neurolyticum TaxID=2120 RepID=A0A449A4F4_9BACT|nr:PTS glucose transporter subunit IIB [Mesomycoplasma neurolyticum]VEU59102.1 PTS system IIB component [Mesomycoplasma neurolyticum]
MTISDKLKIIFLSIVTFGTIWIYWSKLKNKNTNTELSLTNKLTVNLDELIEYLGGTKNIVSLENTHKKIRIFLKDTSIETIKKISELKGVSGVVLSSDSVNLIVGNSAQFIKEKLEKML